MLRTAYIEVSNLYKSEEISRRMRDVEQENFWWGARTVRSVRSVVVSSPLS